MLLEVNTIESRGLPTILKEYLAVADTIGRLDVDGVSVVGGSSYIHTNSLNTIAWFLYGRNPNTK
jgi:hypothetical protein